MAVFEGLGKKITRTGQEAARKTKSAADSIRLNNQIAEAERAVSAYCDIIGREYYAKYAAGGWDSDFDEMFVGIENEKERIANCKAQLRAMRGVVECADCGRELSNGMNFCSYCGAKIVNPEPVRADVSEKTYEPEDSQQDTAEQEGLFETPAEQQPEAELEERD